MPDDHGRVIIHMDIDCFYAQVEMNKNPKLREEPMGVQQKNIVVTCNYPARARGVGKCMYISQAKEVCPELVLVNGEDLADYRRVSSSVYSLLCETGCPVERLGMDENWLDVTRMVNLRIKEALAQQEGDSTIENSLINKIALFIKGKSERDLAQDATLPHVGDPEGHIVGDLTCLEENCPCIPRLVIGSHIAKELRSLLKERHNLTSSAGICYNKVLAKMVGSFKKPDQQTILPPGSVGEILIPEKPITVIPGVGRKTGEQLSAIDIKTIGDLRSADLSQLVDNGINRATAETLKGLAWGIDQTEVKMSGRPVSVGLEDRFMGIYDKNGCLEKLRWLLGRLTDLLAEDGRKPATIKVTVRDYYKDKLVKKFHKESRQSRISSRLFQLEAGKLKPPADEEILEVCLALLGKMIDFNDAFHITLLGLSVTDFVDQVEKKSSIKNFLISPKKEGVPVCVPTADTSELSGQNSSHHESVSSASDAKGHASSVDGHQNNRNFSRRDVAKKPILNLLQRMNAVDKSKEASVAGKRKSLQSSEGSESNYFLQDKRLRKDESILDRPSCSTFEPVGDVSNQEALTSFDSSHLQSKNVQEHPKDDSADLACPSCYDKEVWDALPETIKREILAQQGGGSAAGETSSSMNNNKVSSEPSSRNNATLVTKTITKSKSSANKKSSGRVAKNKSILSYFSKK